MRRKLRNQYTPDDVSPPGATLVDVLNARGMSQAELADRTGRPKKTINEIIKGKAMITSETAVQFERVLGAPASFWTMREAQYREHCAKVDEARNLTKFITWPQRFPLVEMRKRAWIPTESSGVGLVRDLLGFFGIASPSNFNTTQALGENHFRKSTTQEIDEDALAVWLRRGEIEALQQECSPFSRERFEKALESARSLTSCDTIDFLPKLKSLCQRAGVAVVFVQEFPKIRTNGATRWLSPEKALIQLSLRYKRADILWFTFFHEAGHILLHGKKQVFVEMEKQESTENEREADHFAREMLIPSKKLREFVHASTFSRSAIENFASEIGVHPGIVVGRLQHDGHIHFSEHKDLFMGLEWAPATN